MVSETIRLQLYPITYPRKDKYESRYIVKKRESEYKRKQPRHPDAQRRVMNMTNNKSRWNAYCITQKRTSISNGRRNTRTNQENPNKRQEVTNQLKKNDGQSWEENRIVYINSKIYVPRNKQLRDEILGDNHNPPCKRTPHTWLWSLY